MSEGVRTSRAAPVDPSSATMRLPSGPAILPATPADRTPTLLATPADVPVAPEARTLPASGRAPPPGADGATALALAGPAAARYALERELGRGGMGAVFQVFDRALDRRVALKVVLGDARRDPDLTGRFVEEARAMARLERPGVGERTSLFRLLEVFTDICRAVGFAHERGIVHRDL